MNALIDQLDKVMPTAINGSIVRTEGMLAAVAGFPAPVGAVARIERQAGPPILGEVVGFRDALTLVFPYEVMSGVRRGNRVSMCRTSRFLRVGDQLLGRVIDAHGETTDQLPPPSLPHRMTLDGAPPAALERPPIEKPITTGVRAMDGLLTCGTGQRMGIFSGSGVGKSVLLGMMARNTSADVNVIAMIGERGREVNEFLTRDLGDEGRKRSVVVVATSDQPAILRVQAAMTATTVAEYFRDQGKNVMLLMDSVTRFAMAQREIGLAAGEPPATRGYPPSVFSMLPKLVERAGCGPRGSITAFYTVLVEGDDTNEPISDAVRGLLDGHTILSRDIAAKGHFPAIDVLQSISRLMPNVADEEHRQAAMTVREVMAAYQEHRDLITIGAYRSGSNAMVDTAIAMQDDINGFLRQGIDEASSLQSSREALLRLAAQCHSVQTSSRVPMPADGAKSSDQPGQNNPTNANASPSE
jgi:FliI/YscN family ATPase